MLNYENEKPSFSLFSTSRESTPVGNECEQSGPNGQSALIKKGLKVSQFNRLHYYYYERNRESRVKACRLLRQKRERELDQGL